MSEDTEHYLFIKHYNTISITEDLFHTMLTPEKDPNTEPIFLTYEFNSSQMQSAFDPFLICIRNLYMTYFSETSPKDFIEACQVYSLQKDLFISYLENEKNDPWRGCYFIRN